MKQRIFIQSDKDTHFTNTLAQNAQETENITAIGCNDGIIRSVCIQSDQNLDWDVMFWGTDAFDDTDLDVAKFLGGVKFTVSQGLQIGGAGQYYYMSDNNLGIPYKDMDGTNELHISLINRSVTSKNAGSAGEVVVAVAMDTHEE